MHKREAILDKIGQKEKEWEHQIQYLQIKSLQFDIEKRVKTRNYVTHLDTKLKRVKEKTDELKNVGYETWERHGDKIAECWEELVHNVDFVIANYKKLFE